MKATLTQLGPDIQVIQFGEYTRLKFDFGDEAMKYIEIGVGEGFDGKPCLDIRSAWNGLSIEPVVSNVIKVGMV